MKFPEIIPLGELATCIFRKSALRKVSSGARSENHPQRRRPGSQRARRANAPRRADGNSAVFGNSLGAGYCLLLVILVCFFRDAKAALSCDTTHHHGQSNHALKQPNPQSSMFRETGSSRYAESAGLNVFWKPALRGVLPRQFFEKALSA